MVLGWPLYRVSARRPELMALRGVALAWWRRWRGVEGAVAQEGARRSLPGDGPVRAAEDTLTGGSRRHSAWAARRLARGASGRPPSGVSPGDAWVLGGGERGGGVGGRRGCEGGLPSGDQNRAALRAMSMPFLAWSRPCQRRHRHLSLNSGVKKGMCNLGKQNIFVLAKIFPRGVGMPCAGV